MLSKLDKKSVRAKKRGVRCPHCGYVIHPVGRHVKPKLSRVERWRSAVR